MIPPSRSSWAAPPKNIYLPQMTEKPTVKPGDSHTIVAYIHRQNKIGARLSDYPLVNVKLSQGVDLSLRLKSNVVTVQDKGRLVLEVNNTGHKTVTLTKFHVGTAYFICNPISEKELSSRRLKEREDDVENVITIPS